MDRHRKLEERFFYVKIKTPYKFKVFLHLKGGDMKKEISFLRKGKKFVLPVLYDIRPVDRDGNLDFEKIQRIEKILDLAGLASTFQDEEIKRDIPADQSLFLDEKKKELNFERTNFYFPEVGQSNKDWDSIYLWPGATKPLSYPKSPSILKEKPKKSFSSSINWRAWLGFLTAGFLIALTVPAAAWFNQGLEVKKGVLRQSASAYENLLSAHQSLKEVNWSEAESSFSSAYIDFQKTQEEINELGRTALNILEKLPGGSLLSSGEHLVKVGEGLAQAGRHLTFALEVFNLEDILDSWEASPSLALLTRQGTDSSESQSYPSREVSLTKKIALSRANLMEALFYIREVHQSLEEVKSKSLPQGIQASVASLKEKLPLIEEILAEGTDYFEALLKILGHSNPRQYLLLFQNNSEIRATGGFVGTYGLLTLDQGCLDELFVEGVFNADGQLHEKIIPPRPIQKISTAWSMHDANWFADFPTSAQKVAWFYEKTGGPTVDGVIALTPVVVERLLELTGPIAMPEYGVVLNSQNFVELVQYKVESDYDKRLNQPKKILADFAPKFLQALRQLSSSEKKKALEVVLDCLEEKHILVYFTDEDLEKMIKEEGWGGELRSTEKDYLSVVSSNINGYKTDRVIDEKIDYQVEIKEDGSVIGTLKITRHHRGGTEKYDWWNRVNANYLRVYLPKGTELISVSGQTRENYQPPIDYQKYSFRKDPLVASIEEKMVIDPKSGTRIFEENGKTVFGNWVYVSPGETVTLIYQYQLPFRVNLNKSTESYSLLVQKQAGSLGSDFRYALRFPSSWRILWSYPTEMTKKDGLIDYQSSLKTDKFFGVTLGF